MGSKKQNRFRILCVVIFCAVLFLVSAAAASNTAKIVITATVISPLKADFTATPDCTNRLKVTFAGSSSGGDPTIPPFYTWNFGDGTTYDGQYPPIHTYTKTGTYKVTLTVTKGTGSSTVTKTIIPYKEIRASFTYSPAKPTTETPVTFTDTSKGIPTKWKWEYQKQGIPINPWIEFGSGAQNPSFPFTDSGKYNIRLTATNPPCLNSKYMTTTGYYITVMSPCDVVASFTCTPLKGNKPLPVTCTDSSTGSINKWEWDFHYDKTTFDAEGTGSSITYSYTTAGKFYVAHRVTSSCSPSTTSTLVSSKYIYVK